MQRYDTCAKNLFFLAPLSHAVCVTRMKMCAKYAVGALCNRKMCARHRSECTPPVVHTVVSTTCVRTPSKTVEKNLATEEMNIHHSMTILTNLFNSSSQNTIEKHLRFHHFVFVVIFLAGMCSISWLFNYSEWKVLRFPEA